MQTKIHQLNQDPAAFVKLKEKIVGAYEALRKAIFIIATTLVIFIALRNSLIWHLEEVWGASKTLWSSLWAILYRASGENHFMMFVPGSVLAAAVPFVLANAFFAYLDLTGKPAFLLKYKIQEDKAVPVNWEKYKKALVRVTFNTFVVGFIFNLSWYPLALWRGMSCGYELPTFTTTVLHIFVFIIWEEIGFYYLHRLFHHPQLYKRIHKTHHEWTAPVGIISIYNHPLEHYMVNLLPAMLGPIIMGSHLAVTWLCHTLAIMSITVSHCGYHFPFLPSPEAHDFHHAKFNQNFGTTGVLDRLHGTDELFRRSKAYERHILLLSFIPVKEFFPDPPKAKACCK